MSRKYKFRDRESIYFVSFSVVHWIDLLIRTEYREVMIDSLKYCQKEKGLEIYAWCLMTSHVHLIISSEKDKLEDIMRDFKRHTSVKLKEAIISHPQESRKEWMLWMMERAGKRNGNNANWQLWQQNNHHIELSNNEMMDQKLEYLHNNPVEAGFVLEARHWQYSSARDYHGDKGFLEIRMIN